MPVLGEDDDEQRVEVQTLHQQPEEVGHDEVLEEDQAGFTAHLRRTKRQRVFRGARTAAKGQRHDEQTEDSLGV